MISSIKFDRPRVTGPLDVLGLGCWIISFSSLFFLVIHAEIQTFISTLNSYQFYWKVGGGESILLARYAGSYLPFLIPNSLSTDKHHSL